MYTTLGTVYGAWPAQPLQQWQPVPHVDSDDNVASTNHSAPQRAANCLQCSTSIDAALILPRADERTSTRAHACSMLPALSPVRVPRASAAPRDGPRGTRVGASAARSAPRTRSTASAPRLRPASMHPQSKGRKNSAIGRGRMPRAGGDDARPAPGPVPPAALLGKDGRLVATSLRELPRAFPAWSLDAAVTMLRDKIYGQGGRGRDALLHAYRAFG